MSLERERESIARIMKYSNKLSLEGILLFKGCVLLSNCVREKKVCYNYKNFYSKNYNNLTKCIGKFVQILIELNRNF